MRPGDVAEASDFKVLSFDVKRIVGNDGSITKTARATILDERSGEEVVLTHKEPLYVDRVEIVLRSEQDPSIEVRPQAVGEAFETPLGQYVLDAIDLDGESVTVTKQGDNDFEPETRVLTLQVPVAEPTTTEIESTTFESTEPSSGGAFDGIFQ